MEARKKTVHVLSSLVVILLLGNNANAKCNKEDINYYLEKGFTPDQVTALCSEEVTLSNKTEEIYKSFSDEYADEQDEEYIKKMRIERQVFFKSALGAQNIKLRRDHLIFDQYECAKDGMAKPGSDLNYKGCAVVLTKIKLSEIEVSEKEFKEKVSNLNLTLKISDSIDSAIHSNSKDMNTITLVTGSLYLIGEVLNLN